MKIQSIFNAKIFNAAFPLQGAFSPLLDARKETEQLVAVICWEMCDSFAQMIKEGTRWEIADKPREG